MKNPIAVHVGSGFQPAAGLLPGVATIAVVLGIIAFPPAALAAFRDQRLEARLMGAEFRTNSQGPRP